MEEEGYKAKIEHLNERSDQVQEILGRTPNWMIRWGTSLVFAIVALLLVGSAIVSYNDVIPAEIVITSKNPPIYLKARSSGRLTQVLTQPDEVVSKGQVLAEIENTASYEDVIFLQKQLDLVSNKLISLDSLKAAFPAQLNLGEMQALYGTFLIAYQNMILYQTLAPNKKQSALLRQQLTEERKFLANQKRQLKIFEQNLALAKSNYERNKKLFEKDVISRSEFENVERRFLEDQQRYESIKTAIFSSQISLNEFTSNLTRTNIEGTEFENTNAQDLQNAEQNLRTALTTWDQQYLLRSPIDGKVTVFDIWDRYQNVDIGEVLFTVVPHKMDGIIGRVSLPVRNSGKVKEGQSVLVKLDNYPYEEWGSLSGKIESISEVPLQGEETVYTLYITLENLETSFGKTIAFKQEMQGRAEIVVEELSVLQRVFYELRKVFD
ncbi:HlyD family secretion protein [Croceivirga thetidis]|uniref:HlyD family efflux transporter periplasmic adaptor subunit n=1 Tax=Croceivirga thetidis TaxID=2721623 RepID=A0ABX1GLM8_9FLAO|nr:HlyD family efflux transporter periplasmic adaptor subunit [Croceivirga thetidis]NKI30796.1 HlyD family efflux transporter periplasmic adaptor subunit [Croceivirga thetidis]